MFTYNADPYLNSRVDVLAQDIMRQLGMTSHDFLVIEPYSIGDAYHTLALMKSFRQKYFDDRARLFFACAQRSVPLAHMFAVANVVAACAANEFLYESFAGRYQLSAGVPIITTPDMHANGWLARLVSEGFISGIIAKKIILGLDLHCPLSHPVAPEQVRTRAEENAKAQGVICGESLLILNHASTLCPLPVEAFAKVVETFPGLVFTDTSVTTATLIPGTRPIQIPLAEIIPTAEIFGTVLALRSGLVDVLCRAKTRLFSIYPRLSEVQPFFPDRPAVIRNVRNGALAKMGLAEPGFENTIFLEDHESIPEISEHLAQACCLQPAQV